MPRTSGDRLTFPPPPPGDIKSLNSRAYPIPNGVYRLQCGMPHTYLMPRAKRVTQTSRKPSGNLALRDSLTFSLLAKLNSLPSSFVTWVRSTSLLLYRLYKECKTTPNYFSPTPTSHGEGEERPRKRGREWVKEEKTSTTSDSLALDGTFKPINY